MVVTLVLLGLGIFALNGLVMLAMLQRMVEFNKKYKHLEGLLKRVILKQRTR